MAEKRASRISTFGSRLTSIISVTLVLLIMGMLAMIGVATHSLSDTIKSNVGLIIKIQPQAGETEIENIRRQIGNSPYVASCIYTSADEVLAQELEYEADIIELIDENPYSAELDIRVKPAYACADSINKISAHLSGDETISEILTDSTVIDNVNSSLNKLSVILMIIAAALLTISLVLINNTVSLSVYSRRFVIHTMKLVGATGGFIRRPFITAGIYNGIISAILASAILAGTQVYITTIDPALKEILPWHYSAITYAALILAGIIICGTASIVATNRYLRSDYDEMFMK